MRWQDGRLSDNINDARDEQQPSLAEISARAGMAGAGLMLLSRGNKQWMVILAIFLIFLAIIGFGSLRHAEHRFMQRTGFRALPSASVPRDAEEAQRHMEFVSAVLAETEDVWTDIFRKQGKVYQEPGLILYHTAIRSACGAATTAIGPFYCPNDRKIYLDETFFNQLSRDFGAPGDFAAAYVIAHEAGHHIQNLDGTLAKVDAERSGADEKKANELTVRLELQADCYAGIWANYMKRRGVTEPGDIALALNAAHKIGDDYLQKTSQGYAVPDSFTHGTSNQRAHWFAQGLKTGNPKACNTIDGKL